MPFNEPRPDILQLNEFSKKNLPLKKLIEQVLPLDDEHNGENLSLDNDYTPWDNANPGSYFLMICFKMYVGKSNEHLSRMKKRAERKELGLVRTMNQLKTGRKSVPNDKISSQWVLQQLQATDEMLLQL